MEGTQLEEILKLDVEERLRIVQIIWDSIAAAPEIVPLTTAEIGEIDQRLAEDDVDPNDVMTWQEAKDLIERPR